MEPKVQTKVTDANRKEFYQTVYSQQLCDRDQLIDLSVLKEKQKVIIDSCGWHYKHCFPEQSIISLENIKTAWEYQLSIDKFDKMFDGRQDDAIRWPAMSVDDCALIFDRAPMLKYLTIDDLISMLSTVSATYCAATLVTRMNLNFVDDWRLTDRLPNIAQIAVPGYVVKKFHYDIECNLLEIRFKRQSGCKKSP